MASVKDVLSHVQQLPALPTTVLQLTAVLSRGNAELRELEELIKRDESVAMTVLKFANSATFGRSGKTFDLRDSITRLGARNLMKIVLQQKVSNLFSNAGAAHELQRGAMWRSSLGGALAAEQIAKSVNFESSDMAFLCALLRDIGKLAMETYYGRELHVRVAPYITDHRTYVEAERMALGYDHAEMGYELAMRWKLPERFAQAIRCHHEPPSGELAHDDLFDIVHAADMITLWAGLAIGCDGLKYTLAEHVRVNLGLDRQHAEHYIADMWFRLCEMEAASGTASGKERKSA